MFISLSKYKAPLAFRIISFQSFFSIPCFVVVVILIVGYFSSCNHNHTVYGILRYF